MDQRVKASAPPHAEYIYGRVMADFRTAPDTGTSTPEELRTHPADEMAFAKVLAVAALAVVASGPAAGGLLGGGYPRGPTPAFGGGYSGYNPGFSGPPQPYSIQYLVRDPPSGNDFGQKESGDGSGAVRGEYHVLLPDGRRQTVTYSASDATGYVADVQYSGTPHYPSGPSGGFGGGYGGGHGGGYGGYGGGLASTYLPPHGK